MYEELNKIFGGICAVIEWIYAVFVVLLQSPEGIHAVCKRFPLLKIVTSEIDSGLNDEYRVVPGMGEFGDRYFGTDDDAPDVPYAIANTLKSQNKISTTKF